MKCRSGTSFNWPKISILPINPKGRSPLASAVITLLRAKLSRPRYPKSQKDIHLPCVLRPLYFLFLVESDASKDLIFNDLQQARLLTGQTQENFRENSRIIVITWLRMRSSGSVNANEEFNVRLF